MGVEHQMKEESNSMDNLSSLRLAFPSNIPS